MAASGASRGPAAAACCRRFGSGSQTARIKALRSSRPRLSSAKGPGRTRQENLTTRFCLRFAPARRRQSRKALAMTATQYTPFPILNVVLQEPHRIQNDDGADYKTD